MFTTESEAWAAIADTLEIIEGLPLVQNAVDESLRPVGKFVKAKGLCDVLIALRDDRLISASLQDAMFTRIDQLCDHAGRKWLFKKGEWKPRAKLARRFAAESQSEEARRVQN